MAKWFLDTSNSEYRTIRAKEPIKKYEKIFEAEAFSLTVHESKRNKYCNYCLNETSNLMKCGQCGIFYYCSENCQKQDWSTFHKYECEPLRKSTSIELKNELILTLRLWDIYKQNESFRESIVKMKSHEKSYSEATKLEMMKMATQIVEILKEDESKIPVILGILSKVKINFFTIEKPSYITNLAIGTGFYQGESNFFNHSCMPNSLKIYIGRKIEIYACEDIKPNEEIFICYDELMGRPFNIRQTYLKENYNMECGCRLCLKEKVTSNTLYPNIGLKCNKCPEKALIFDNICSKCSFHYSSEDLSKTHKELEGNIETKLKSGLKYEELSVFLEDLKKNHLDSSSYLIEIVLENIISTFLETHKEKYYGELYKLLKFYLRNYEKWYKIEIPSFGFKYNELSKLALIMKKGKKAKKYAELAWKYLSPFFLETQELLELKKRISTIDMLLEAGHEMKNDKTGVLRID